MNLLVTLSYIALSRSVTEVYQESQYKNYYVNNVGTRGRSTGGHRDTDSRHVFDLHRLPKPYYSVCQYNKYIK